MTEIDPQNPDGWVNIGRAAVQEGDMERARTVLEKALALVPNLARTNFFYGSRAASRRQTTTGAAAHLQMVLAQYPRDRVALNDLGRVLFPAAQICRRREGPAVRCWPSIPKTCRRTTT